MTEIDISSHFNIFEPVNKDGLPKELIEALTDKSILKLSKDKPPIKFGFFDVMRTTLKEEKLQYFLAKIKKQCINTKDEKFLSNIYSMQKQFKDKNPKEYFPVQLNCHWEDQNNLYLLFKNIPNYISLTDYLSSLNQPITDAHLLQIYSQILKNVQILHKNERFGTHLYMSSFIVDLLDNHNKQQEFTIRLTDLGFSKLCKPNYDFNFKLKTGFEINEYMPREYILEMDEKTKYNGHNLAESLPINKPNPNTGRLIYSSSIQSEDDCFVYNESYDIWQLGILFYKIANNGVSPYNINNKNISAQELKQLISRGAIDYSPLNERNSYLLQLIQEMLNTNEKGRKKLDVLIEHTDNAIQSIKDKIRPNFILQKSLSMRDYLKGTETKTSFPFETSSTLSRKPTNANINYSHKSSTANVESIYDLSELFKRAKKEVNEVINIEQSLSDICQEIKAIVVQSDEKEKAANEELINMFKQLNFKQETIDYFNQITTHQINRTVSESEYKEMIRYFIFEIQKLKIDLDREKSVNKSLTKKIKEINEEYQEKITFLESKSQLLESVVFPETKSEFSEEVLSPKVKLFLDSMKTVINNFNEINQKLANQSTQIYESLNTNIEKFFEEKKEFINDIVKGKIAVQEDILRTIKKNNVNYSSNIESLIHQSEETVNNIHDEELTKKIEDFDKRIEKLKNNSKHVVK